MNQKQINEQLPSIEVGEVEGYFIVSDKRSRLPYADVAKMDGLVGILCPIKGAILPESFLGFELAEQEENARLSIKYRRRGVATITSIGIIERADIPYAVQWITKVNAMYK